jgi:hypothetical protein
MNAPDRREGAAAILLATRPAAEALGLPLLGQLVGIERDFMSRPPAPAPLQSHYDSDAIELLVARIRERHPAQPLRLQKADGSSSTIVWHP